MTIYRVMCRRLDGQNLPMFAYSAGPGVYLETIHKDDAEQEAAKRNNKPYTPFFFWVEAAEL